MLKRGVKPRRRRMFLLCKLGFLGCIAALGACTRKERACLERGDLGGNVGTQPLVGAGAAHTPSCGWAGAAHAHSCVSAPAVFVSLCHHAQLVHTRLAVGVQLLHTNFVTIYMVGLYRSGCFSPIHHYIMYVLQHAPFVAAWTRWGFCWGVVGRAGCSYVGMCAR